VRVLQKACSAESKVSFRNFLPYIAAPEAEVRSKKYGIKKKKKQQPKNHLKLKTIIMYCKGQNCR